MKINQPRNCIWHRCVWDVSLGVRSQNILAQARNRMTWNTIISRRTVCYNTITHVLLDPTSKVFSIRLRYKCHSMFYLCDWHKKLRSFSQLFYLNKIKIVLCLQFDTEISSTANIANIPSTNDHTENLHSIWDSCPLMVGWGCAGAEVNNSVRLLRGYS